MTDEGKDNASVIAPPPLIYLFPLILGLRLNRKFPAPFLPNRSSRLAGWPVLGAGIALAVWFNRTMREADTPVSPQKPVSRVVTDGPFRYTRNPGYLSLAMIYAGISTLRNSLWSILLLPVVLLVIRYGVIAREERYLERKFGEEYLAYKSRVRRWI